MIERLESCWETIHWHNPSRKSKLSMTAGELWRTTMPLVRSGKKRYLLTTAGERRRTMMHLERSGKGRGLLTMLGELQRTKMRLEKSSRRRRLLATMHGELQRMAMHLENCWAPIDRTFPRRNPKSRLLQQSRLGLIQRRTWQQCGRQLSMTTIFWRTRTA
jgi:hypothetical protein